MTRKGYNSELTCKKKLMKEYGSDNVIKVAIGSFGSDFIVVKKGKIIKCVEVKEIHSAKYYPMPQEKIQFARIKDFCDEHDTICELWINHIPGGWVIDNITTYI